MQHAAIYCRLSREDGDNIESSSIASQKKFLTEYATKNGYKIFDTYIDDGYSGTDFDRPDFKRMISDVEKGFIDAVIVKDLSRLGRNYLKSGYYLEEYFPAKNVKFIAINDSYDSSVGDNEFAPFKNIMNEWYAKDISKKITTTHRMHQEKGIIPSGKLPLYGYTYDENRRRVVNIETAAVVKFIYEQYVLGKTIGSIASELAIRKIYIPGYWYYKHYDYNVAKYSKFKDKEKYEWTKGMVQKIVCETEYDGSLILRKTRKQSFKNHKTIVNPKSERLVFQNFYEPIIDPDTYAKVRKIREARIKTQTPVDVNRYRGIVFCKNCGKPLVYRKYRNDNMYYLCHNPECKSKAFIKVDVLDGVLKSEITKFNDLIKNNKKLVENYAKNYINSNSKKETLEAVPALEIEALKERLVKIDKLIAKLFESEADGTIPKATFQRMMSNYTEEQKDIENKLNTYSQPKPNKESIKDLDIRIKEFFKMISLMASKEQIEFVDLQSLFDKINVYKSKNSLTVNPIYKDINLFIEEFNCNVLNK